MLDWNPRAPPQLTTSNHSVLSDSFKSLGAMCQSSRLIRSGDDSESSRFGMFTGAGKNPFDDSSLTST